MKPIRHLAACALACLLAACATPPPLASDPPVEPDADAVVSAIPGLHAPRADLLTAGQPAPEAWDALAARGVTTVVNLRSEAEMAGRDQAAEVVAAGMDYHHLPIASADDLTPDNAARLRALVANAPGRVLVHCASANRAGALLALGELEAGTMTPDEALVFAREAGLSSAGFEAQVRPRLGLPPADADAD